MKNDESFAIVMRPGRCYVGVTRAAYVPVDEVPNGYYLVQAEATAAYVMVGGETMTNFQTQGAFIARDESFLIWLGPEDRFSYYLPAGGTLRLVPIELVRVVGRPRNDAQYGTDRAEDRW